MDILLETNNVNDIPKLVESILEEEFLRLSSFYECGLKEMDYWIKSQIIERLSDDSVSFNADRFSQSGGNFINDYIRIFVKEDVEEEDEDDEDFEYLVVLNEEYIEENDEIRNGNYKECYIDYDKGFELFRKWAYEYIEEK